MDPHPRSSTRTLTTVAIVVAGVGAFVSGVGVRQLILTFTLDAESHVPTGSDYRIAALGLASTAGALLVLAGVACLGRGVPRGVLVVLAVLVGLTLALAVHDVTAAGSAADPGDVDAEAGGLWIILLLVPTSWPLVGVVLVRPPVVLLRRATAVRGRSTPAPR